MKKTISILGCGWLGIPLAEYLIEKSYIIKGSTRSDEKIELLNSKGIIPFKIALENLDQSNISEFLNTDILIIATTCKNPIYFSQLMTYIEASRIKTIIFISSTSVYPFLNRIVTENDHTIDSLLAHIEQVFISNTRVPSIILRFAGLIGPKRNPAYFFRNGKIVKQPEGYINLIHLQDCIQIIYQLIKREIKSDVLNACSDEHHKRKDFYTALAKRNKLEVPTFQNPKKIEYKIVGNKRLKQLLDYKFNYPNPLEIPNEAYE